MRTGAENAMLTELSAILSPERVLSGPAVWRSYDCDAYTVDRSAPTVVVLPSSTQEVQRIVRWCHQQSVPFTPRGAGTGLSGGAMPALGGVVISLKRMTQILEIDADNRQLQAQAGIPNLKISKAVEQFGLHFAPDPSSQSVATLGGNIAENSGGPHTLKYGVTAQHIRQVTLIDPEGESMEIGGRVPGGPGLDFLNIVVGGEGTVGIVTEAWVNLTPIPPFISTALVAFSDVRRATGCVSSIIETGILPAALEMMDRNVLVAVRAAFGLEFHEDTEALLLIECDGEQSNVQEEIDQIRRISMDIGALDFKVARDPAERQALWTARKKGIGAMGRLAPTIVTHDGVIPRSLLPEMLDFVYAVAKKHDLSVANIFHAGDGNLHPCFYFDDREEGKIASVVQAGEEILRKCIELGGSVSGEHGIGVEKLDLLKVMFSPADIAFQSKAKSIFNSGAVCNPCKVIPDQKGCVEHMRRWRGSAS